MPDDPARSENPRASSPARINRTAIGLNVAGQFLLVAAIVAMLNYLGFNWYKRWDLSRSNQFSLAEQTRSVLTGLRGELRFVVFFSPGSPVFKSVDGLLKEYQYAGGKQVTIEFVDPYRNFTRARELQAQYKFGADENVIAVDFGGRHKLLTESDLAEFDQSGMMFGQPPQLTVFKGEQALTGAVLEVTEENKRKLFFIAGLGQKVTGPDSPFAVLLGFIDRQYIDTAGIDLAAVDRIPDDATVVCLPGPKYDLSEREITMLRDYWSRAGRLIILRDPAARTPRLDAFLKENGIFPNDDRVLRTVNLGTAVGILRDVSATFVADNPATRGIENATALFLGETQSLSLRPDQATGGDVQLKPLMSAAEGFWGEVHYRPREGEPVIFQPTEDRGPPVTIAASVEKGGLKDERVRINSSRMVVVGNAAFIESDGLTGPNVDFFLNCVNWLSDRERMIGIAPKAVEKLTLNLSEAQVSRIAGLAMVAMPASAAALGILVWLRRRK